MTKIIVSIIVVLGLIVVGGIYLAGQSGEYELTVDSDLQALEDELASTQESVESGEMTNEEAVEARSRIMTRLDALNANLAAASDANLSVAQRAQLQDSLTRLKTALISYQETLNAVDEAAAAEVNVRTSTGTPGRTLTAAFIASIEAAEDVVEDISDDYQSDEALDELIEDIEDDSPQTLAEIETEANATSTATTTDETATDTDEEEGKGPSDSSTTTVEIETEGEVEVQ